ncbi:MAG: NAD(P)H-dependent oxidoreductase [Elusimicrobiales bacterium]|nr:NAD(P)H-dependent oxidoreductase [Elusimicrobiales bacterium]
MIVPRKSKIFIIYIPPTYSEITLDTLSIIPPSIFKLISYLKSRNNQVEIINLMQGDEAAPGYVQPKPDSFWKYKNAGIECKIPKKITIAGYPPKQISELLKNQPFKPDEIWLSSSFTCDYELVNDYIVELRKKYPTSIIRVGGDFIRYSYPWIKRKIMADYIFTERIIEADTMRLDYDSFKISKAINYGLFQLQIGCSYSCSFCAIKDYPKIIDTKLAILDIKELYDRIKPVHYWNFDPNITIFKKNFIDFMEKYNMLKIPSKINFVKGLQINKIDKQIAKLIKNHVKLLTTPIEATTFKTAAKMNKPYTVISTIKALQILSEEGFNLFNSANPFLLGYPEDDLNALFRAFLISLKYNSIAAPFPVFIFPGTKDFNTYKKLIKNKDFSLLHGQLWPLLPSEKVNDYDAMVNFMIEKDNNIKKIPSKIDILPKYMKNILLDEIEKIDSFIEKCLNANTDNIETLKKIEEAILAKKIKTINKNIKLHIINASFTNYKKSLSIKLKKIFINNLKKIKNDIIISETNLSKKTPPFITSEYIEIIKNSKKIAKVSTKTNKVFKYIEKELANIENADILLITTPMYTLTIPAALLSYFELIASYCYFFRKKMINKKNVIVIITRGGTYPENGIPYKEGYRYINCQEITIDAIMDMLGISQEVKYIVCQNQFSKKNKNKEIKNTILNIKNIINELFL